MRRFVKPGDRQERVLHQVLFTTSSLKWFCARMHFGFTVFRGMQYQAEAEGLSRYDRIDRTSHMTQEKYQPCKPLLYLPLPFFLPFIIRYQHVA